MAEAKTTKPKAAKAVTEKAVKTAAEKTPSVETGSDKTNAAKPAVKAKKTVAEKPKTGAAPKKTSKAKTEEISPALRYRMTEVAAYYIAEKHHFTGNKADFWAQAEKEINAKYPK